MSDTKDSRERAPAARSAQLEARGVPLSPHYGSGVYRRGIRVVARPGVVTGELEDDFHHFRATLEHDGERITRATGEALRVPWTTCPGAVRPVALLRGLTLTESLRACAKHTNPRAQCTHLFDAACLAVAFVASGGTGTRTYGVDVPDRVDGRTRAALRIDGEEVLAWDLAGNEIAGPPPFSGQALSGGGFGRWAESTLPPDAAVNALVLQKGIFIGAGRRYRFDEIDRATVFGEAVGGACHTFSPEHESAALRVYGSVRDFSSAPDTLLVDPPDPIPPDSLLALPPVPAMRVLFVCIENSNRSQMAEAFARIHGAGIVGAYSAGSRPSGRVNPKAVESMRERSYDLAVHRSKSLSEIPDFEYDFVVTMGCGDACPTVRAKRVEDWSIPDPKEMSTSGFREVRDEIERRVKDVLQALSG